MYACAYRLIVVNPAEESSRRAAVIKFRRVHMNRKPINNRILHRIKRIM